jgi:hypothetical protein
MAQGIRGEPSVLAPAVTFAGWRGKAMRAPKDVVGVTTSAGKQLIVFGDPAEVSYVVPHGEIIILVQAIHAEAMAALEDRIAALDTRWKPIGEFRSVGGEYVLFDALHAADDYDDEDYMTDEAIDPPVRITIPKGAYVLEIHTGETTAFVFGRLVPL